MQDNVVFIEGGIAVDDRGQLLFCNDFDMSPVKRFYAVSNHKPQFIRAWHAHKNEAKFVFVPRGSALVCTVKIDNWENPSKDLQINRYVLSAKKPGVLFVPKGYANGFMTLEDRTQVMFFSDRTLTESKGDDYRYDSRYWDPWEIVER